MFKINPNPNFTKPVTIPDADGTLTMIFKRRKQSERAAAYDTLQKEAEALDAAELTAQERVKQLTQIQADFLLQIAKGWEDCEADFSKEAIAELLDTYPEAFKAITTAYAKGGEEAAKGN